MLGPFCAGEALDLVVDELAAAGGRRAQNDQLSGVMEMTVDGLIVLGAREILFVPKHVQPAMGQWQIPGRHIVSERLLTANALSLRE